MIKKSICFVLSSLGVVFIIYCIFIALIATLYESPFEKIEVINNREDPIEIYEIFFDLGSGSYTDPIYGGIVQGNSTTHINYYEKNEFGDMYIGLILNGIGYCHYSKVDTFFPYDGQFLEIDEEPYFDEEMLCSEFVKGRH